MQSLKDSSITAIQPIPGLFISDRFAARSLSLLRSLDITHILSVTRPEDAPKYNTLERENSESATNSNQLILKQIDIDDDPLEDLLCHLKDACDWIKSGLTPPTDAGEMLKGPGVLVHCVQGISRSGAIIVAYLMRTLSLPYAEALSLARESRPLITPNSGFEEQLLIWEIGGYDVLTEAGREKEAYQMWKRARDGVFERGEEAVNKARAASMAKSVAVLGKRRLLKTVGEDRKES